MPTREPDSTVYFDADRDPDPDPTRNLVKVNAGKIRRTMQDCYKTFKP
jgi:hypothetical protein